MSGDTREAAARFTARDIADFSIHRQEEFVNAKDYDALAERAERAEAAQRDFAHWRTHWRHRAMTAEEALESIIEASRDFTAPNWWVAVKRIEDIARAALGGSTPPTEGET